VDKQTAEKPQPRIPRNLIAVSLGSFFTDISSEMIINLLPLFLTNVLGAQTAVVGLIEGVAESTASLTRFVSGWLSDKLGKRKGLTVFGYSLSAVSKPLFLLANTWPIVLLLRFADRLGKGIRTAPRDALVADSVSAENRGFSFGLHRAADTAGATVGLAVAAAATYAAGATAMKLTAATFHTVVWLSILPGLLGVVSLIILAREAPVVSKPKSDVEAPAAIQPAPRRLLCRGNPVHPRQFLRRISRAALAEPRAERVRRDAGDLRHECGLHDRLHACRFAVG
jgi:hypothetical protein